MSKKTKVFKASYRSYTTAALKKYLREGMNRRARCLAYGELVKRRNAA